MTESMTVAEVAAQADEQLNQVRLVGRVAGLESEEKVLPSGDVLRTFRVVVARAAAPPGRSEAQVPRQRSDALDCVTFSRRVRRSVAGWREGDLVEVTGAIRKRFFRTAAGLGSRVEVEVTGGRRLRRTAA